MSVEFEEKHELMSMTFPRTPKAIVKKAKLWLSMFLHRQVGMEGSGVDV